MRVHVTHSCSATFTVFTCVLRVQLILIPRLSSTISRTISCNGNRDPTLSVTLDIIHACAVRGKVVRRIVNRNIIFNIRDVILIKY